MKLQYYTTPDAIYAKNMSTPSYMSSFDGYRINDAAPQPTHSKEWWRFDTDFELSTVSKLGRSTTTNHRWELRDDTPAAIRSLTSQVVTKAEACEDWDDDTDELCWGDDAIYYEYRTFYTRTWDTVEGEYEPVEFEAEHLGEVQTGSVENHPGVKQYTVQRTQWKHQGTMDIDLGKIARFDQLTEIMTPELLRHNFPCSITSEQSFKIIRHYVNQNHNSKYARVSNDYDFCYAVEKVIPIKPYVQKTQQFKANGKPYAKPRFTERTIANTTHKIFEMTHTSRNYEGYTPVQGFEGDSLQDLYDNVQAYLGELIARINEPLTECQHCNGTGHIL